MNCPSCGTNNLDTASICVNCGKPLTNATPHSYTPPPPSTQSSYGAPPQPAGEPIPNYLVQAIIVTLCCCLPFGVVAIIFAAQVNSKLAAGDIEGARAASKQAKMWCWIAVATWAVLTVIWLAFGGVAFLQGYRDAMANR